MTELLTNNYVRIIFSTLVIYLFIVVGIRLFGKTELAQLSIVDMVFILLISNAVQNAMVGPDATLTGGLVAATTLFIVNFIFKSLQNRFPGFNKMIEGKATMLIYKGKISDEGLKNAGITFDELMEAVREHGVAKVEDVDLAILEVDGNVSVLSDEYQKHTVKKRKTRKNTIKTEA